MVGDNIKLSQKWDESEVSEMLIFFIVTSLVSAYLAYKYYVASLVLSAWIVENNFTPPTKEDSQRLAKWVAQKMFEKKH